jgi:hypothetical protein
VCGPPVTRHPKAKKPACSGLSGPLGHRPMELYHIIKIAYTMLYQACTLYTPVLPSQTQELYHIHLGAVPSGFSGLCLSLSFLFLIFLIVTDWFSMNKKKTDRVGFVCFHNNQGISFNI